jgi:hypothetical protein
LRPPRREGGQALVELLVTAGVFVLLLSASYSLVPRMVLPAWVDESLACRVRFEGSREQTMSLAEMHAGGGVAHPLRSSAGDLACAEETVPFLPLLPPRDVFPGVERSCAMTVSIPPLLAIGRESLSAGSDTTTRRLMRIRTRRIGEDEVHPLVGRLFLGGLPGRIGLLRLLRPLGIEAVRVNLDAVPQGAR